MGISYSARETITQRSADESAAAFAPPAKLGRDLTLTNAEDVRRDLSLRTLANKSGYSRLHLVRMFRAAAGTAQQLLAQTRSGNEPGSC